MPPFLTAALLIFALRVIGITFATLRVLMIVRGRKGPAWIFGLLQSLIYVVSLIWVLSDLGNWLIIVGYAAGFATGVLVGMIIENRLAIGYTNIRVVSPGRGIETAEDLRNEGFAVTEVSAQGLEGAVSILHCSVLRKDEKKIIDRIIHIDPEAFITAENVRLGQHGFWKS
jgi:uncharacterized protein YebE (UPF0316 family)